MSSNGSDQQDLARNGHGPNLQTSAAATTGTTALAPSWKASVAVYDRSYELKAHAPFTILGTLTGVAIMLIFAVVNAPRAVSVGLFWSMHPLHVLLSALVTTAMFTIHSRRSLLAAIAVGYCGSVGIATLSDCVIPYVAEILLDLPNRGIHLGFIEKWWLVNPLAVGGHPAGIPLATDKTPPRRARPAFCLAKPQWALWLRCWVPYCTTWERSLVLLNSAHLLGTESDTGTSPAI